jgi:hypothetical protein
MPKYSLNPIVAQVTTTNDFEPVEIDIQIENLSAQDTYTSLGIFTFTSDASSQVKQQIESILHAAMMAEVDTTIPPQTNTAAVVPGLSRKFRYRHRHYTSAAWTSWTTSTPDFVVLGGIAYELWNDNIQSPSGPIRLHFGDVLCPFVPRGFVYVLTFHTAAVNYTFSFQDFSTQPAGTATGNITPSRAFDVVRIPIQKPSSNFSPFFELQITQNGINTVQKLEADFETKAQRYDFLYLGSNGGWNFLPCDGAAESLLEVSQAQAEIFVPDTYRSQADISQFEVYEIKGRKKTTAFTGYMPKAQLDFKIQDFLMSRKRYIWVPGIIKWVPVLVNAKGTVYRTDGRNLMSFGFEWSPAFENNLPSTLL